MKVSFGFALLVACATATSPSFKALRGELSIGGKKCTTTADCSKSSSSKCCSSGGNSLMQGRCVSPDKCTSQGGPCACEGEAPPAQQQARSAASQIVLPNWLGLGDGANGVHFMYRQERRPPKCLRIVGDNRGEDGVPAANALCFAAKRNDGKARIDGMTNDEVLGEMQSHVSFNKPNYVSFHKQEKETYKRGGVLDTSLSADPSHLYKPGYRYKVTLPADCAQTRVFDRGAGVFECRGHTVQLMNQPKNVNEITLTTPIPCAWVTHYNINTDKPPMTENFKAQWIPLTAQTWKMEKSGDC